MARIAYLRPEKETKSDGAFLTISEVAAELDIPQHVLRFWETRFSQIKPLKMRGGRRYYRPEDVVVLHKIKTLLYSQGYTIKGAKKAINSGELIAIPPMVEAAPRTLTEKGADVVSIGREQLQSILSELYEMRDLLMKSPKIS